MKLAATYSPTGSTSSTIRAVGLNGRVRDGNGCDPHAIATNISRLLAEQATHPSRVGSAQGSKINKGRGTRLLPEGKSARLRAPEA